MDRNTVVIDQDNGSCILAQGHLPPIYFCFANVLQIYIFSESYEWL